MREAFPIGKVLPLSLGWQVVCYHDKNLRYGWYVNSKKKITSTQQNVLKRSAKAHSCILCWLSFWHSKFKTRKCSNVRIFIAAGGLRHAVDWLHEAL